MKAAYGLVREFNPKKVYINFIIELTIEGMNGRAAFDENTEITLPAGFWSELAMFAYNLDAINGFSSLTSTAGTLCMIQK